MFTKKIQKNCKKINENDCNRNVFWWTSNFFDRFRINTLITNQFCFSKSNRKSSSRDPLTAGDRPVLIGPRFSIFCWYWFGPRFCFFWSWSVPVLKFFLILVRPGPRFWNFSWSWSGSKFWWSWSSPSPVRDQPVLVRGSLSSRTDGNASTIPGS